MITRSRNVQFLFILVAMFICFSNPTLMAAKNTVFNITGVVEESIAISQTNHMTFGRFTADTSIQTITLNPVDNKRAKTGAIVLVGGEVGDALAAKFGIIGAANASYHVTINGDYSGVSISDGTDSMAVSAWRIYSAGKANDTPVDPDANGMAVINALGADILTVGATLTVGANQPVNTYTLANIPIAIEYE